MDALVHMGVILLTGVSASYPVKTISDVSEETQE